MSRTDESKYHGGWFDDEIVALASLCLGVRLASGGISRRFDLAQDPYGQPVEWDRKPKPAFGIYRYGPVLSDLRAERALDGLARLESILSIEPRRYISLVRACSLYRDALWISESSPHLAWMLLISALETGADDSNRMSSTFSSVYDILKLNYPDLTATLERVGGVGHALTWLQQLEIHYDRRKNSSTSCCASCQSHLRLAHLNACDSYGHRPI